MYQVTLDTCEKIENEKKNLPFLNSETQLKTREIMFPTLIIINRTDVFDAQNAKSSPKQIKKNSFRTSKNTLSRSKCN